MLVWIVIATLGGILAIGGLWGAVFRYRRGRIGLPELLIILFGFLGIVSLAVGGLLIWNEPHEELFVMLLPVWFIALAFARRRRLGSDHHPHRQA